MVDSLKISFKQLKMRALFETERTCLTVSSGHILRLNKILSKTLQTHSLKYLSIPFYFRSTFTI